MSSSSDDDDLPDLASIFPSLRFVSEAKTEFKPPEDPSIADRISEHLHLAAKFQLQNSAQDDLRERLKSVDFKLTVAGRTSDDDSEAELPSSHSEEETVGKEEPRRIFCVKDSFQFFCQTDATPSACLLGSHAHRLTRFETYLLSLDVNVLHGDLSSLLMSCHPSCISDCRSFVTFLLRVISVSHDASSVSACHACLVEMLDRHPQASQARFSSLELFPVLFNYGIDVERCPLVKPAFGPKGRRLTERGEAAAGPGSEIPGNWTYNFELLLRCVARIASACVVEAEDLCDLATFFMWMSLDRAVSGCGLYAVLQDCIAACLGRLPVAPENPLEHAIGVAVTLACVDFSEGGDARLSALAALAECVPGWDERCCRLKTVLGFVALNLACSGTMDDAPCEFGLGELRRLLARLKGVRSPGLLLAAARFVDMCTCRPDPAADAKGMDAFCDELARFELALPPDAFLAKSRLCETNARLKAFVRGAVGHAFWGEQVRRSLGDARVSAERHGRTTSRPGNGGGGASSRSSPAGKGVKLTTDFLDDTGEASSVTLPKPKRMARGALCPEASATPAKTVTVSPQRQGLSGGVTVTPTKTSYIPTEVQANSVSYRDTSDRSRTQQKSPLVRKRQRRTSSERHPAAFKAHLSASDSLAMDAASRFPRNVETSSTHKEQQSAIRQEAPPVGGISASCRISLDLPCSQQRPLRTQTSVDNLTLSRSSAHPSKGVEVSFNRASLDLPVTLQRPLSASEAPLFEATPNEAKKTWSAKSVSIDFHSLVRDERCPAINHSPPSGSQAANNSSSRSLASDKNDELHVLESRYSLHSKSRQKYHPSVGEGVRTQCIPTTASKSCVIETSSMDVGSVNNVKRPSASSNVQDSYDSTVEKCDSATRGNDNLVKSTSNIAELFVEIFNQTDLSTLTELALRTIESSDRSNDSTVEISINASQANTSHFVETSSMNTRRLSEGDCIAEDKFHLKRADGNGRSFSSSLLQGSSDSTVRNRRASTESADLADRNTPVFYSSICQELENVGSETVINVFSEAPETVSETSGIVNRRAFDIEVSNPTVNDLSSGDSDDGIEILAVETPAKRSTTNILPTLPSAHCSDLGFSSGEDDVVIVEQDTGPSDPKNSSNMPFYSSSPASSIRGIAAVGKKGESFCNTCRNPNVGISSKSFDSPVPERHKRLHSEVFILDEAGDAENNDVIILEEVSKTSKKVKATPILNSETRYAFPLCKSLVALEIPSTGDVIKHRPLPKHSKRKKKPEVDVVTLSSDDDEYPSECNPPNSVVETERSSPMAGIQSSSRRSSNASPAFYAFETEGDEARDVDVQALRKKPSEESASTIDDSSSEAEEIAAYEQSLDRTSRNESMADVSTLDAEDVADNAHASIKMLPMNSAVEEIFTGDDVVDTSSLKAPKGQKYSDGFAVEDASDGEEMVRVRPVQVSSSKEPEEKRSFLSHMDGWLKKFRRP